MCLYKTVQGLNFLTGIIFNTFLEQELTAQHQDVQ